MAKYFTSVYKNYYDKITNSNILNNSNQLNEKINLLNNSVNNYRDYVVSSAWDESGKNDILSNYIPKVNSNIDVVKNNYTSLHNTTELIAKDLFNSLKELKNKDEEYVSIQNEVRNGVNSRKSELNSLDNELITLVNEIDRKILNIKNGTNDEIVVSASSLLDNTKTIANSADGLDKLKNLVYNGYVSNNNFSDSNFLNRLKDKVKENKTKKSANGSTATKTSTTKQTSKSTKTSGNVNTMDVLGSKYDVIKSNISPLDYQEFAYNKGIRQNSDTARYSDLCLAFSYVHASNIHNGSYSDNAESAYNWKHASEFKDYFNDNKTETLKVVYDQVMDGKPVVLQVNGNKSGTSRHFVTVVGVKNGINREKISEQDLLIIDSWDGKLERMDESTSRFMTTGKDTHKNYTGYYLRLLK